MKSIALSLCTAAFALLAVAGCSSDTCDANCDDAPGGRGGAAGSSGSGTSGSGGSSAGSGGSSAGSGGSSAGSGGSSAGSGGSSAGSGGATSGAGGSDAGTGGSSAGAAPTDSPSDTSAEGIAAFLEAASYKGEAWVADVDSPRATDNDVHGMVRVWFNRTLRQSKADGETTPDIGSMVVKELYGASTSPVGHAVLLRTSATQTTYYCESSEAGLCYSAHPAGMNIYGTSASATNCACHGGGTIITPVPPP